MGIWNQPDNDFGIDLDKETREELMRRGILPQEPVLINTPASTPVLRRLGTLPANPAMVAETVGNNIATNESFQPKDPPVKIPIRELSNTGEGGLAYASPDEPTETEEMPPRIAFRPSQISGSKFQQAQSKEPDVKRAKQRSPFSRWWRGFGDNLRSGGDWFTAAMQATDEAVDPASRAGRVKNQNLGRLWNDYSQDTQMEKAEQEAALRDVQRQNILDDNALNAERLKYLRDEAEEKRKTRALTDVFKSKRFNKSNPAQRKLAELAGLNPDEMPDFNFDLNKATVNGETFVWNGTSFEQSGLPVSEKDKLMDFEVTVPGEKTPRRFRVTADKAASLSASLAAAGMRIEAAAERQEKGFVHDEKMAGIRADLANKGKAYQAKLDEIKAEKDQSRKLTLQKEAATLREDYLRLRVELDQ